MIRLIRVIRVPLSTDRFPEVLTAGSPLPIDVDSASLIPLQIMTIDMFRPISINHKFRRFFRAVREEVTQSCVES